jgi:transposase
MAKRRARIPSTYLYQTIFHKRNDFQHKESARIVSKYGHIFAEDLNILGMARTRLANLCWM